MSIGAVLTARDPARGSIFDIVYYMRAVRQIQRDLAATRRSIAAPIEALLAMQSDAVRRVALLLDRSGLDATEVYGAWCRETLAVLTKYRAEREAVETQAVRVQQKVSGQLAAQRRLRRVFTHIEHSASGGRILVPGAWNERIDRHGLVPEALAPARQWNDTVTALLRLRRQYAALDVQRTAIDQWCSRSLSPVPNAGVNRTHGAQAAIALHPLIPIRPEAKVEQLALAFTTLRDAGERMAIVDLWATLEEGLRRDLADRYPVLIGALDGADARSRARANRKLLEVWLADDRLPDNIKAELLGLRRVLEKEQGLPVSLYSLALIDDDVTDQDGVQGNRRVAATLSIGDVDAADDVIWGVFGMASSVARPNANLAGIRNLVSGASRDDPQRTYAGMAWWGYDSPNHVEEPFHLHARLGGERLARDIDAFVESRGRSTAINLVTHSYGSITGIEGLRRLGHRDAVRAYVALGSPGLPHDAKHVLGDTPAFAANAIRDTTADLGQYISNSARSAPVPMDEQSLPWGRWNRRDLPRTVGGIQVISAEATEAGEATTTHSLVQQGEIGYLTPGSTSLETVIGIISRRE